MFPIQAGVCIRRFVRRYLLINNIQFTEEKGFIDSLFMVSCDHETYIKIVEILNKQLG